MRDNNPAPILKVEINGSRYTTYNSNEFQAIIYNAVLCVGLRYDFGENIRVPLENTGDLVKVIGEFDWFGIVKK